MATYLLLPLLLGFIFGFIYRFILKSLPSKKLQKRSKNNIGKPDRLLRFFLGAGLFFFGFISGSFLLLFSAGFCFFEAIFSWCGFFAILGRNTCPI